MLVLLAAAAVLAIVVLPQFWVRHTFSRHGAERPDLPGTGGELARHLLDRYGLNHVTVDSTEAGDHYDPDAKAVRLQQQHFSGRSLAAVAAAAHEVSHAIQDARGERMLALRQPWQNWRWSRIALPASFSSPHRCWRSSFDRHSPCWRSSEWESGFWPCACSSA